MIKYKIHQDPDGWNIYERPHFNSPWVSWDVSFTNPFDAFECLFMIVKNEQALAQ